MERLTVVPQSAQRMSKVFKSDAKLRAIAQSSSQKGKIALKKVP